MSSTYGKPWGSPGFAIPASFYTQFRKLGIIERLQALDKRV